MLGLEEVRRRYVSKRIVWAMWDVVPWTQVSPYFRGVGGTVNDDSSGFIVLEDFEVVLLGPANSMKRQNMPRKDFLAINASISMATFIRGTTC